MTRDAARCSECGHPRAAHTGGFPHFCRATVYEYVSRGAETSGMNAWPCTCDQFKEASVDGD